MTSANPSNSASNQDPGQKIEDDRQADLALQQELRMGRTFSLADVIAQEAGSFLKGGSPIPPLLQATTAINLFITQHLVDSSGAVQAVLQNWVKADSTVVSQHLTAPLLALKQMIQGILANPELLYEFVRQVDVRWGEIYGERPYFQRPGQAPHADDEYTHESVRQQLAGLLTILDAQS